MVADPCGILIGDLGGGSCQRCLVDIGEREVAAAPGQRQRNPTAVPPAAPVTTAVRPASFSTVELLYPEDLLLGTAGGRWARELRRSDEFSRPISSRSSNSRNCV
jgi:hypothetical protein